MEDRDSDIPLPKNALIVGIVYNLKKGIAAPTVDAEAELDSIDTVHAIKAALVRQGCRVVLLEADKNLPQKLSETKLDLVFNIAEGINGRDREAQVPALLDMLDIPYTGSDAATLCIALDKALTKRILATYHIKTPPYQLLHPGAPIKLQHVKYPVIVKPNAEGSSKGISDVSIARNAEELTALLTRNLDLYRTEMLVEGFVSGREFTVGIVGNGADTHVFSPMEIVYTRNTQGDYRVYSYTVKQDYTRYVRYECPAHISELAEQKMIRTAKKIYDTLACRDFARIDFRLSDDEREVHFIEINPLPGLAPGYSDFPMLAEFCGVSYDALIERILHAALQRTGAMNREAAK
ncbi:MAG: ATP-grasp domain-containing protein [Clostridia bacterium]